MHIFRLSQKVAAELIGVTPRTLRDWTDAPRNEDGTYAGPALVQWLLDRNTPADEYDDQRQRLAAAQAERVERENAVARGDLARRADVVKFWTDCIAAARSRLLALPARIAADLPAEIRPAVLAKSRELVHEALRDLAEYEPEA